MLALLGRGTEAFVVRARDRETDEEVACRIPRDDSEQGDKALLAHYHLLRKLRSRHLAGLHSIQRHLATGTGPAFRFLVLEFVDGLDLHQWCSAKPIRMRLRALVALAETLSALAAEGASHGDVTVHNVLMSSEDRLVLVDPDADRLGASRPQTTTPTTQRLDRVGLAEVVKECLSVEEFEGIRHLMHRLTDDEMFPLDPATTASALKGLLSMPSLPGEFSGGLPAVAARYKTRNDQNRETFRRIVLARDVAFRILVDMLQRVAIDFDCTISDPNGLTTSQDHVLRLERGAVASTRGTLMHRNVECMSPSGDRIHLSLEGPNDFRMPWPFPEQPGLMSCGWFNVIRGNESILEQRLELRDLDSTPRIFIADPDRLRPLDQAAVERTLRVLVEDVWPAIKQPQVVQSAVDPNARVIQHEFLQPIFDRLGMPNPTPGVDWLKAAIEVALRLPQNPSLGNGIWGSGLPRFFEVPENYDERLKLVRSVNSFRPFFSPLYRLDVQVLDPLTRKLQTDLEGRLFDGQVVHWTFETAYPGATDARR